MERRPHGFTLIEVIVAMTVLCMLLTLGLPAMAEWQGRMRVGTLRHALLTSLAYARSQAVTSAVPVSVCPIDGAQRCADGSAWDRGWMIYRDPERSDQPRSAQDILRVDTLDGRLRVRGSLGRPRARFQPDGRSGGSTLTLRICGADVLAGEVILNNSGRPRSTDRRDEGLPCEADTG